MSASVDAKLAEIRELLGKFRDELLAGSGAQVAYGERILQALAAALAEAEQAKQEAATWRKNLEDAQADNAANVAEAERLRAAARPIVAIAERAAPPFTLDGVSVNVWLRAGDIRALAAAAQPPQGGTERSGT